MSNKKNKQPKGPSRTIHESYDACWILHSDYKMCAFIERFLKHMWKSNGQCCLATKPCLTDSFTTAWTVACQDPLSVGFPRQEYWSGLPFPSPSVTFFQNIFPTKAKPYLNQIAKSTPKDKGRNFCIVPVTGIPQLPAFHSWHVHSLACSPRWYIWFLQRFWVNMLHFSPGWRWEAERMNCYVTEAWWELFNKGL